MKAIRPLLKFGFFASVLLGLGIMSYRIAVTQIDDPGSFPETGHTVTAEFLAFYQQAANPELVYGYPITEQMTSKDGMVVQYFQKARFELHPEMPQGQQVTMTPLGRLMHEPGEAFSYVKNPAICRTFETGFDVCYAFLEYFDQQGGITQFGLPISEVEEREGRLVQYFEYTRLEWYPDFIDAGLSQEIQITYLGRQYFSRLDEDPIFLEPPEGNSGPEIISVHARAFPARAVVSAGDQQTVYVIVQDQNLNPIREMSVVLTLTYPDGVTTSLTLPVTNNFGYTSGDIPFSPPQDSTGFVEIEVIAFNDVFRTNTRTSFRILP